VRSRFESRRGGTTAKKGLHCSHCNALWFLLASGRRGLLPLHIFVFFARDGKGIDLLLNEPFEGIHSGGGGLSPFIRRSACLSTLAFVRV